MIPRVQFTCGVHREPHYALLSPSLSKLCARCIVSYTLPCSKEVRVKGDACGRECLSGIPVTETQVHMHPLVGPLFFFLADLLDPLDAWPQDKVFKRWYPRGSALPDLWQPLMSQLGLGFEHSWDPGWQFLLLPLRLERNILSLKGASAHRHADAFRGPAGFYLLRVETRLGSGDKPMRTTPQTRVVLSHSIGILR